jgi:hypothetical protein
MDFIKGMYEDGLVEQHLDEDAMNRIRGRRNQRLKNDRSIALYGYLVGIENARRATMFIEMAEERKSIPKNYVEAYLPIIEMIDDIIVDGGPQGVQLLRQLHKRLKK